METNQTVEEGKTMAIISYVTIIGLIIAFVSNNSKPNEFTSFHIRQSLGIFALWIIISFGLSILSSLIYIPWLSTIVHAGLIVLLILGIIAAAQGEKKPVPLVGDFFQDIFKNIWVRIVSLEKEQFCTLRFLFYRYGKTHALTSTQLPTFRY